VPVITAPADVTAGQAGYTATVPAQSGSTCAWTVTGAAVTAGAGSDSITFTAGASGTVGFSVVVTNAAGIASAPGTASSVIVADPTAPVVAAPADVTAGQGGYAASVPAQAGSSYAWTVTGGTVTAGAGSDSITFTAGASGTVGFSVVVTNAAGTASVPGTASSTVVAAPATPVVTAPADVDAGLGGYTASVPAQAGSTYAWTVTGGTVTAGAGSDSITFTAGASGAVGFSVVVSNAAGTASVPGTASSVILSAPTTPVVTAPADVTAGQAGYTASVPAQAGSSYAWTVTGGTITAGAGTDSITFTAGASGTVGFSVVVSNAAGPASAPGTTSSAIVAAPATPVVTAPANVTAGQAGYTATVPAQSGSTYAWTVTGGTITAGAGTDSLTFTAGASGTVGFSAVVKNAAGTASAPGTAASAIVAPPSLASFTASLPSSGPGGPPVTLTGTFTGGTGAVDHGVGAVTSGTAAAVSPAASTTYTLTVTNLAGTSVSAATRVVYGSLGVFAGQPSGVGNLNGSGGNARFFGPSSSAVDDTGNLYVADRYNNTIRMISPGGVVTTLAGTADLTGSSDAPALFNGPTGIAVDNNSGLSTHHNIYVADTGNNNIRLITVSGGVATVTTLAGTGTSGSVDSSGGTPSFYHPMGLAVDTSGNLYVADTDNNTIREITGIGGTLTVSTLAGQAGTPGSSDAPSGPATQATFNGPQAVAVATPGNLYVADTGNATIRMITSAGLVSTVAGTAGTTGSADGTPGTTGTLDNPMGVAVDASGNVYIADTSNSTIRLLASGTLSTFAGTAGNSGSADGIGTAAQFEFPTGVTLDGSGNLVVTDRDCDTIRTIPVNPTTPPTTVASTATLAGEPRTPGMNNASGASATFNNPNGLAVDTLGNVYVADSWNNAIRVISPAGAVTTLAGTGAAGSADSSPGPATFNSPNAVAVDNNPANSTTFGNVYVADVDNSTIRRIAPGGTVTTLAGTPGSIGSSDSPGALFNRPLGVAVDGAGNVYVADTYNSTIRKVAPDGTVSTLAGTPLTTGSTDSAGGSPLFNLPFALAVDPNPANTSTYGNIYVADTYNSTIRLITPDGVVSTLAGSPGVQGSTDGTGGAALFDHPANLAVDPATGNLYVADTYNQTVRLVTPAGAVTTLVGVVGVGSIIPGSLPASLAFPWGIAVAPAVTLGGANPAGSLVISVTDAILASPF
jgi:hypothetical protein